MVKCRDCGMELGNSEYDICKECCRKGAEEFVLRSKIREEVRRELGRFRDD